MKTKFKPEELSQDMLYFCEKYVSDRKRQI
jgi:hypothetical protein